MTNLTVEQEVRMRMVEADPEAYRPDNQIDGEDLEDWILYGRDGRPEEEEKNKILSGAVDSLMKLEDGWRDEVEEARDQVHDMTAKLSRKVAEQVECRLKEFGAYINSRLENNDPAVDILHDLRSMLERGVPAPYKPEGGEEECDYPYDDAGRLKRAEEPAPCTVASVIHDLSKHAMDSEVTGRIHVEGEGAYILRKEEPTPGTVGHLRWLLKECGDDVPVRTKGLFTFKRVDTICGGHRGDMVRLLTDASAYDEIVGS